MSYIIIIAKKKTFFKSDIHSSSSRNPFSRKWISGRAKPLALPEIQFRENGFLEDEECISLLKKCLFFCNYDNSRSLILLVGHS